MTEALGLLSRVLNLQNLFTALLLVAMVLAIAYVFAGRGKKGRRRPGQLLRFESPGRTAAACRDLLSHKNIHDIFAYELEAAPGGGWYIHLTRHNPTEQILDTLFLLQFEKEEPARFSLKFIREAFGQREPVMPEAMLAEFFQQKLDARLLPKDEA